MLLSIIQGVAVWLSVCLGCLSGWAGLSAGWVSGVQSSSGWLSQSGLGSAGFVWLFIAWAIGLSFCLLLSG